MGDAGHSDEKRYNAALYDAIDAGANAALDELAMLCAVPSVSAKGEALQPCAKLVAKLLRRHGIKARLMPTAGGPPLVIGEARCSNDAAPTVLFYNHYDVQPVEPLDLWDSDPFALTFRDGRAYARGAADDKGHIVSRLLALEAVRAANGGALPFHVKFLVDGEEEVGSPHLGAFIEANKDLLQADACIWEEGGVDDNMAPVLYCGMRGIAYFELFVKTIAHDAHSGVGGSLFPNAAWRIVWALGSLKGPDERIRIPGHYDRARPAESDDLELLEALPGNEQSLRKQFGLTDSNVLGGFKTTGLEFKRRAIFEPTLTVCGLSSGWEGAGSKTVLPSEAVAKIDFRLVPDQDPEELFASLRAHLDAEGFPDVEIRYLGGQRPARIRPDHPLVALAASTGRTVYGKPAGIAPLWGSSGPQWWFSGYLGMPVVSPGIEYPGVAVHAPNEHIRLIDFTLGTRWLALLLAHIREAV